MQTLNGNELEALAGQELLCASPQKHLRGVADPPLLPTLQSLARAEPVWLLSVLELGSFQKLLLACTGCGVAVSFVFYFYQWEPDVQGCD